MQNPPMHVPVQQSDVDWHDPPSGEHVEPDCLHTPFWHTPPPQQSESDVQVPLPSGMQLDAQTKAPRPASVCCCTQMWLQHSSHSEQECPAG